MFTSRLSTLSPNALMRQANRLCWRSMSTQPVEDLPVAIIRKNMQGKGASTEEVAKAMHAQVDKQRKAGTYPYDRYIKEGSRTKAIVSDYARGVDVECVIWSINHYLGLNHHAETKEAAMQALMKFGTGSGTGPKSGGLCQLHLDLEYRLATDLGKERVLLFPTGFTSNLGFLGSILGKNDLILSDAENHASIIEGTRTSDAKVRAFKHNDMSDLEAKLKEAKGRFSSIMVCVESAFSLSGDFTPIYELVELKKKYNFLLFVDEAHTFGFYGKTGMGFCEERGVLDDVDFIMSSLSKATASIGGFVAMDAKYATMIEWNARSHIFHATFPAANAAATMKALDIIQTDGSIIKNLHKNNDYFRGRLLEAGFDLRDSVSPVVPIYISNNKVVYDITNELFDRGVYATAVTYPAVSETDGRLRFVCSTAHTKEQIDHTVDMLIEVCTAHGVIPAK